MSLSFTLPSILLYPRPNFSLLEYGVLHSMHCRKFILEKPDATDKNGQIDVYGLHKDGNLYANKAMYSVDHYCIELTQMDTIDVNKRQNSRAQ